MIMISVLVFEWILLVTVRKVILNEILLLCPGLAPRSPHRLLVKIGHGQSLEQIIRTL